MSDPAVVDLARGQAFLFGGLVVCAVVDPGGLTANHGISYYGVQLDTVPILAVGLLGAAWFTRRGLRRLADQTPAAEFVRHSGTAIALLLAGIVVTPYTVATAVDWTHRGLGAALFILQLVLGIRLVAWTRDTVAGAYWAIQLLGGVISAYYVLRVNGYLLESQLLFQLGFGALALRTARLLAARDTDQEWESVS